MKESYSNEAIRKFIFFHISVELRNVSFNGGILELLDPGRKCWTLDSGRIPKFLDSRRKCWTLDSGRWTLDAGVMTLDSGRWTLDSGPWTLDSGR